MAVKLNVNGEDVSLKAAPEMPLLWALRDELHLFGAKYGCGVGLCGACTVLVDGKAARSCMVLVSDVVEKPVITIEGLSVDGSHPVQVAWREMNVPLCGFCQSGQIMQASALLAENPNPSDPEILDAMQGNLCRCGSYQRIVSAIRHAARSA
jgi:isoquinoline 1-oxidoreductase alpha subunit